MALLCQWILVAIVFVPGVSWAAEPQPDNLGGGNGTTFFVDAANGSDGNSGTTESAAWRTLDKAISEVTAGDTVLIKEGDYYGSSGSEYYDWNLRYLNGAPGEYITFKAFSGQRPRLHVETWNGLQLWGASYLEINGLEIVGRPDPSSIVGKPENDSARVSLASDRRYFGNGISVLEGSHHIRIVDNLVHDVGGNGISGAGNVILIEGNEVFHTSHRSDAGNSGISVIAMDDSVAAPANYGLVVRNNYIYDVRNMLDYKYYDGMITDGNAIILDMLEYNTTYTSRNLVANNVAFGNGGRCVHVFHSRRTDVVNNTCFDNLQTRDQQAKEGQLSAVEASDVRFFNNIATGPQNDYNLFGSNLEFRDNLVESERSDQSIDGSNLVGVAPAFYEASTDPAVANFMIAESSPAVDAGSSFSTVDTDIDGVPRPQGAGYDIGAYEVATIIDGGDDGGGDGTIAWEKWTNVSGLKVSDIPLSETPDRTGEFSSFEAPTNQGDQYGLRLRGLITAPVSGNYTFWIAGDDYVELWLSDDDQASGKSRIAHHTGWTSSREWNKYSSQKSASIYLAEGQQYYVEALMKEASGGDNLAVGWAKPGQSTTSPSEVIPGSVLSPVTGTQSPAATCSDGVKNQNETDVDCGGTCDACTEGENCSTDGDCSTGSCSSGVCTVVSSGGTGTIAWEMWTNVSGWKVSDIPVSDPPDDSGEYTSFEAPTNQGDDFGLRVRGFITAPVSGNYTFWIAGDDYVELWLSDGSDPSGKSRIAYHTGWTNSREWNKYASQKSASVYLVQGQQYYVEALLKEGSVGDNLAVGWAKPGQSTTSPSEVVPGSVLSPSAAAVTATCDDGLHNQDETDVDCGGSSCGSCTEGRTCVEDADCSTGNCSSGQCAVASSPTGSIGWSKWTSITGTSISSIPLSQQPDETGQLSSFEAPTNQGDDYGLRIRGYLTAPESGWYQFWVAGDDNAELWLSTTSSASDAQRVAYHSGWTYSREWNKYSSQSSGSIYLEAGEVYYVEALMKEARGGDNLAVGWLRPGQSGSTPSEIIPGTVLSPL